MIRSLFLLVFISFSVICFSQGFIGYSRQKIRKGLEKHLSETKIDATFQETDSTLILLFRDPKFKPADFIYLFNKNNRCVSEIKIACDTCVKKYMQEAINKKSYEWMKVNETTFLSKYSKHLIMELFIINEPFSLRVKKISWTKRRYKQILEDSPK